MPYIDKKNSLKNIKERDFVILDLGCGAKKINAQAIGIDAIDHDCVDIVGDVFSILPELPSESVDSVFSSHFFEHIENVGSLLKEIHRILKPGGLLEIAVPHFSNPYFYSDPTHKTMFGLYSFSYFSIDNLFKRKVPKYNHEINFMLKKVDLIFKSSRPFYFRFIVKKAVQLLININTFTREFYEENLCYLFPCYEIRYTLAKIDAKDEKAVK